MVTTHRQGLALLGKVHGMKRNRQESSQQRVRQRGTGKEIEQELPVRWRQQETVVSGAKERALKWLESDIGGSYCEQTLQEGRIKGAGFSGIEVMGSLAGPASEW